MASVPKPGSTRWAGKSHPLITSSYSSRTGIPIRRGLGSWGQVKSRFESSIQMQCSRRENQRARGIGWPSKAWPGWVRQGRAGLGTWDLGDTQRDEEKRRCSTEPDGGAMRSYLFFLTRSFYTDVVCREVEIQFEILQRVNGSHYHR